MRTFLSCALLLVYLSGCGDRSSQTGADNTTSDRPTVSNTSAEQERCFRQVAGRDTTTLFLMINGSDVTGELAVLPFEKDRARGPIRGTLRNGQIQADWQRSGEGVAQTYEVTFTMKGDRVTWREGARVEKQGKWVLKTPGQAYEYVLTKADCP